ncbi:MAG: ornithine cyclodeaminase family protein [Desulfopila sp.]|jgi:ornithine cyclodeaminase|nr:ornithine cyclodeaminase family protein [Desulfopila sp.]
MQIFDREDVAKYLQWPDLIEALRKMFAEGCAAPVRHHHTMEIPGRQPATMLLMPAWLPGKYAGLKVVSVYPDNGERGLPTINGNYLLMDGTSGIPVASMDAGELTARRTAAASALAADYLSRKDANKLLIVGSGRLAAYLGFAHGAIRSLDEIRIWARNPAKAHVIVEQYAAAGQRCFLSDDLEEAVSWADIVSCATLSSAPLVLGRWLHPGIHLDLVGSFKPTMRETDDEAVVRSRVFVDTREGALAEAGDLLQPMQNNSFSPTDIVAELGELASATHPGRIDADEITLFKSVGASLEDLAAAICCFENSKKE